MANERQKAAEKSLKKIFRKFELPAPAKAPAGLTPDAKATWELQQEVALLRSRYNLVIKVVWRTSAALIGLAAPAFGWDFIAKIIDVLGVK